MKDKRQYEIIAGNEFWNHWDKLIEDLRKGKLQDKDVEINEILKQDEDTIDNEGI